MKTVAYSCCYVPCEWIAAHEMRPRMIVPESGTTEMVGSTEGSCAYARGYANTVCAERDASAIVVTTLCDQMRRVSELIDRVADVPVFLMNLPATWETKAARGLYVDELRRLGRFLEAQGGKAPSPSQLVEVMLKYDALRSQLRRSRDLFSARGYAEAILAVPDGKAASPDRDRRGGRQDGVALAIVGGELRRQDLSIHDLIEQAGGRVALDATDAGERALPAPLDRRLVRSEPLTALANAYFGAIPHAFQRPDSRLYAYLGKELVDRSIRGIIFIHRPWCDVWNGELQRMRDWASVPLLDLDTGCEGENLNHLAGRIQAFMEILH